MLTPFWRAPIRPLVTWEHVFIGLVRFNHVQALTLKASSVCPSAERKCSKDDSHIRSGHFLCMTFNQHPDS